MRIIPITVLALALGLPACAVEQGALGPALDGGAAEAPRSTRGRLEAEPPVLTVIPAETEVTLGVRLPSVEATASRERLAAAEGEVAVTAPPGSLRLEHLALRLEDAVVSAERLPPGGLRITEVRLSLAEPAEGEARWYGDGDEGYAQLEADLLLDWSVAPGADDGGEPWPLEQQRIEGVRFDVHVSTDHHGNLVGEVTGSASGVVWTWGQLAEIRDVGLSLSAMSTEAAR